MSEWLKEHAWKTNPARLTERHQNTSSRNRFNDFPPQNASRCEPVNVAVRQRFRDDLTQFLHSSQRHLPPYVVVFVRTHYFRRKRWAALRSDRGWQNLTAPPWPRRAWKGIGRNVYAYH